MPSLNFKTPFLLVLLFSEAVILSLSFDVKPLEHIDGFWFAVLSSAGVALKFFSAMLVALFIGLGPRLATYWQTLTSDYAQFRWIALISHIVAFTALLAFSYVFLGAELGNDTSQMLPLSWIILATATVLLWGLALAPLGFWQDFSGNERFTLVLTVGLGAVAMAIALTANELWEPLADTTFAVCAFLLGLVYPDIIVEPETYILGTPEFLVQVGAACSGYEGIGLVLAFTTFYLSVFRAEFRFPQALVLIPIGMVTIWVANTVRITILIILGHEVSPEMAVNAFHSLAGWIFFVFISTVLLLTSHRWGWVRKGEVISRGELVNPVTALLFPLILLLTFTLLTSAFTTDFVWSYPLRVLAVGAALFYLWRYYNLIIEKPLWFPLGIGLGVFIVWVLLVEPDPEFDATFVDSLSGVPIIYAALWLIFRVIGSVITVPLAEELAFRGYLLSRLSGHDPESSKPLNFSWFGMLASSILFGLLHEAWIAGIAAGFLYGWARYQRDKLSDAVIAHGVTNLLLFGYAALTGYWSVW